MLKSMTGYGRAAAISTIGRVSVEIQAVNRKFLDIQLNLSKEIRRFEMEIRKKIAEKAACGQVSVNILTCFQTAAPVRLVPNMALAKDLYHGWQKIAEELKIDFSSQFSLSMLNVEKGLFVEDEDVEHQGECWALVEEALEAALKQFNQMKEAEGAILHKDLQTRTARLGDLIEAIAGKVSEAPKTYREKLQKLFEEVLPGSLENNDRLLRELVVYADRVDVSEEITRFRSHLVQLNQLLAAPSTGAGSTSDFILQELGREINTLGAKSPDIEVSHLVVEVKTELKKMREQVQNIE